MIEVAEGTYEEMCLPLNTTSNPNMEGTTLVLVVVVSEWVGRGVCRCQHGRHFSARNKYYNISNSDA